MPLIIIYTFFTVVAFAVAIKTKAKMSESYPFVAFLIIITGFLLGVLNLLNIFVFLGLAGFAFAAGYIALAIFKKRKLPWADFFVAAIICGGILAVMWLICRGNRFQDWDDFSHWGTVVKIMVNNNSFDTAHASIDGFRSYPPATALLQYFFIKICGGVFREDIAMFANLALTTFCSLLVLRTISTKKHIVQATVAVICTAFMSGFLFPRGMVILGVDLLLGVVCAFAILVVSLPNKNNFSAVLFSFACAVLTLIKSSGFGIAIMLCIIYAIFLFKTTSYSKKSWLYNLLPLYSCLAAKAVWAIHCSVHSIANKWGNENTVGSAFSPQAQQIYKKFFSEISTPNFFGKTFGLSFVQIVVFAIIVFAVLIFVTKTNKQSIFFAAVSSVLLAVLFAFSMLVSYIFIFDAGEAAVLASSFRYLNTAVIIMLNVVFPLLCVTLFSYKFGGIISIIVICTFVGLFTHCGDVFQYLKSSSYLAAQSHHQMYFAQMSAENIKAMGENSRVYVITGNDAGAFKLRLQYELYPYVLPPHESTIRANKTTAKAGEYYISQNDFSRELANSYDYVYIFNYDNIFLYEYLPLFANEADALFLTMHKVNPQPDGTATLSLVEKYDSE